MSTQDVFVAEGVVEEVQATKAGHKIRIGGTWYYGGGRCDLSTVAPGMAVTLEGHHFNYQGKKLKGVDVWGSTSMVKASPTLAKIATPAPAAIPTSPEKPLPYMIPYDGDRLRFCSGVVQSAIEAKLALTPYQAQQWFIAACDILQGKELLDEKIPF